MNAEYVGNGWFLLRDGITREVHRDGLPEDLAARATMLWERVNAAMDEYIATRCCRSIEALIGCPIYELTYRGAGIEDEIFRRAWELAGDCQVVTHEHARNWFIFHESASFKC